MRRLEILLGCSLLLVTACDGDTIPPLPDRPVVDLDSGVDAGPPVPVCDDGVKGGDETGIDCGGSCGPCEAGDPCRVAQDCSTGVCERSFCLRASCTDGVRNGDETGTDCGGDCPLCPGGEPCTSNDECLSDRCRGGMCEGSSCEDGRQNGDETDVDCGGDTCPACAGELRCLDRDDCLSGICAGGLCTTPSCNDRRQNQDETSVDCGGSTCPACRDGLACMLDMDCENNRCLDGGCVSCVDRVRNDQETGTDCGGPLCDPCGDGQTCLVDGDCLNGACVGSLCVSCMDGELNRDETDVDCGGTHCAGCLVGQTCFVDGDCASNDCDAGICRGRGDTCAPGDIITLTPGTQTINWVASGNDYLSGGVSCTGTSVDGPDVVMEYTATVDGFLSWEMTKPASTRYAVVVSDAPCGTTTPEVQCVSDFSPTVLRGQFPVTTGTTYTFYVIDTTSGTMPLVNPFDFTVTEVVPPCTPGSGGMVGTTVTRYPTSLSGTSFTEYYLVADDAPGGFVYVGGTSNTYRLPKVGGTATDIEALGGLTFSEQGYELAVAGSEVFTVDSITSGTSGRLYRVTSDGGATWTRQDYATFSPSPQDDFRSAVSDGTNLYLITHEFTTTVGSEIWSVPLAAGSVPTTATLIGSIPHNNCSGLAVDSRYFYTACQTNDEVVRVDRTTLATEVVSGLLDLSSTRNSVQAHDTDMDGVADILYVNASTEDVFFVCGLGTPTPFTGPLVSWGGSTSNYGLGFDAATSTLYAWDDDTRELLEIR